MVNQEKTYYFIIPLFVAIGFLGSLLFVADFLPSLVQYIISNSNAEAGEALLKATFWTNLLSTLWILLACTAVVIFTIPWRGRAKQIYSDENARTKGRVSSLSIYSLLICVVSTVIFLNSNDTIGEISRCRADMAVLRDGQLLEYTGYVTEITAEPLAGTWTKSAPEGQYWVRISDRVRLEYDYFRCPLAFGDGDDGILNHAGPYQVSYLPNTDIIVEMKEIDPETLRTSVKKFKLPDYEESPPGQLIDFECRSIAASPSFLEALAAMPDDEFWAMEPEYTFGPSSSANEYEFGKSYLEIRNVNHEYTSYIALRGEFALPNPKSPNQNYLFAANQPVSNFYWLNRNALALEITNAIDSEDESHDYYIYNLQSGTTEKMNFTYPEYERSIDEMPYPSLSRKKDFHIWHRGVHLFFAVSPTPQRPEQKHVFVQPGDGSYKLIAEDIWTWMIEDGKIYYRKAGDDTGDVYYADLDGTEHGIAYVTEIPYELNKVRGLSFLPDFTEMPLKELPFQPEELWSTWLGISYDTYPANDQFLAALQRLQDDEFIQLTSEGNFFPIGDYLLYYTFDCAMGTARLRLEAPDGSTETLIDSKHGIQSLFFEDRETLCVEFATFVHYEGGSGEFFFLELKTGDVKPAYYGKTSSGHGFQHQVYRQHHYSFENAKKALDLGDADDIFLQDATGAFHQVIEYAASTNFVQEYIFYLGLGRQELYRADLTGQNKTLVHTFDAPIRSFYIADERIIFRDETGEYEVTLPAVYQMPPDQSAMQSELDRYKTTSDHVLEYTSDTGESIPVLGNFQASLLAVKDDWLYFRTYRSSEIKRYDWWKVKKDGTELTQLN